MKFCTDVSIVGHHFISSMHIEYIHDTITDGNLMYIDGSIRITEVRIDATLSPS